MRQLQRLGVAVFSILSLVQSPAIGGFVDCNGNGIDDSVEIAHGEPDCNGNGVLDECDIDDETSGDCDGNGVPDECDTAIAFGEQVVDTGGFAFTRPSDLDGDGDPDIVAAFWPGDILTWYENLGQGNFGPQQLIGTTNDTPFHVFAGDLDNDGDNDVLNGTNNDHTVAWYENLDGAGTFGPMQIIYHSPNEGSMKAAFVADVDGDDDLDTLMSFGGLLGGSRISWFENTDGAGTFGFEQVVLFSTNSRTTATLPTWTATGTPISFGPWAMAFTGSRISTERVRSALPT